jgi:hypothetical protein
MSFVKPPLGSWAGRAGGVQHCPEHVDAPAGQGDERLMMAFGLAAFAGVEGAAVGRGQRAERRLVEDPFEGLVAAAGPALEATLPDWRSTGASPAAAARFVEPCAEETAAP